MLMHKRDKKWVKVLTEKPAGSRSFGRLSRRWDNIELNLNEMVWKGVVWICLTKDTIQWWVVVNTVIQLKFP